MDSEANKRLVRQFYDEVWTSGNFASVKTARSPRFGTIAMTSD